MFDFFKPEAIDLDVPRVSSEAVFQKFFNEQVKAFLSVSGSELQYTDGSRLVLFSTGDKPDCVWTLSGFPASATAVVTMADSAPLWAALLIMVIGNLVIIVLEGLVVSIQTTRLVLFEFFNRFLRGSGRVFRPLPIPPGLAAVP